MNLAEIIGNRREDDRIALKQGEREVSYRQLWQLSIQIAKANCVSSKIVGIMIHNSIEFVVAFFSALIGNKSVLLIQPDIKEDELIILLKKCEAELIYTHSKYETTMQKVSQTGIKIVWMDKLLERGVDVDAAQDYCMQESGDEVAVIIPTSGTTADRKLVQLTHANIISNVRCMFEIYQLKEGERGLLSLPMTSMFCLTVDLLCSLYAGMTVVIYEGVFSANSFVKMLSKERIDYFITVPSVLKAICVLKNRPFFNFEGIKRISLGGEKAALSDLLEFYEIFRNSVVVYGYGMTECSPVLTTTTLYDYRQSPSSVGKALPGVEIRILDENGEIQNAGEKGEIVVSGPNIMKGYYMQESENLVDGWLYTGDIGFLDQDGYLYIIGRKKNMIISGGKNIYPEEIEMVILDSGLAKEVRVRGIQDQTMGESVVADLVLQDGADVKNIKEYCQQHLSSYKVPKKYIICEEIEKNAMNKIVRRIKE